MRMPDAPQVYLDYNATVPVRPEAIAAIGACLADAGNPSSVHRTGRRARQQVEAVRRRLAAAIGARPEELVFTSGGTEANQLALYGSGAAALIATAVEHESVLAHVRRAGLPFRIAPVRGDGRLDLSALPALLAELPRPALLSVMLANNETGTLQPVQEAAEIVHQAGGLLHTDAIQALCKLPVDFAALGADLMSLSGHKVGGPQGVGALAVADHVPLQAQILGGGQERGRRAGTESVPGIVGFGAAIEAAAADTGWAERVGTLRDRLERQLRRLGAGIQGGEAPRLPNTLAATMSGMAAETQVMAFDLAGFAVSAGSACSSGKVLPSHVLRAMGLPQEVAQQTIRISLGWATTADEVDAFAEAWQSIAARAAARERQAAAPRESLRL